MGTMAAPRIRDVAPEVSEPFARVIDRALEFRREDRYESARAMREDLDRALGQIDAEGAAATWIAVPSAPPSPSSASEPEPPTIVLPLRESEGPSVPPPPPIEISHRRRRFPRWALVPLVLLAGLATKAAFDLRAAVRAMSLTSPSRLSAEGGAGSWAPPVAEEIAPASLDDRSADKDAGVRKAAGDDAAAPTAAKPARLPAPAHAGPAVVRTIVHAGEHKARVKGRPGSHSGSP